MDILLPVATYPDVTARTGLDHALTLSARLGARVTALIQQVDVPPIHSGFGELLLDLSAMAAQAEQLSRQSAETTRLWLLERGASLGLPTVTANIVTCGPESFFDRLPPLARHHNLTAIVLDGSDPQRLVEMEALLFGSGDPALAVPARSAMAPIPAVPPVPLRIVIAWDGTRAASRALRDALPILVGADPVTLVTIGDDKTMDPAGAASVLALLEHHGIPARHLARSRGTAPIGETLQAIAISQQADLLVMGAYGHSRLQQMILGGATSGILHAPRLPVWLSH